MLKSCNCCCFNENNGYKYKKIPIELSNPKNQIIESKSLPLHFHKKDTIHRSKPVKSDNIAYSNFNDSSYLLSNFYFVC